MAKKLQSQVQCFGASVRGRLHQHEGRPNEDAWESICSSFGTAIVVSDGMGSKPNACTGARKACKAVQDALRSWSKFNGASPVVLLRLIHILWGLQVLPASEEDSAATCLFAVVLSSGELLVAKLGDGIAAIRETDGKVIVLGDERSGFCNETTALGIVRSTKEWSVITRPSFPPGTAVLLATDGIADDLVSDRVGDFINLLTEEFACMQPALRWRTLCQELRNWSTPKHLDDKTLAILWHQKDDFGSAS
ncbi:SpoIIE family protein phosphatase [Scytonema sp. UIC 10036]|uniref:PP2C family serine/threonine-protein phosphatase n=1 Tax=Scytonema sp. UIC 10036 TaxID=2304196 RepID=UPI0012DADA0B|nr:PP2C family serine/threonine-protein phosphatase [Scytonema sp. UIC 10036]MUG96350.1 SpoIIE family protein phosphatase [Scytonema sp. UIC 10036]